MDNIALIVVDSLRLRDIHQQKDLAPFLEQMMEENYFLDNYYSNSPWTAPAHASILSGLLPSEHGTTTENVYFNSKNKLDNYFNDYETVGLSENGLFSSSTGMDKGFDEFQYFHEESRGGIAWRHVWEKDQDFKNRKSKWLSFFKKSITELDAESGRSFIQYLIEKYVAKKDILNKTHTDRIISTARARINLDTNTFLFMNITPVHYPYTFSIRDVAALGISEDKELLKRASRNIQPEEFSQFPEQMKELREKTYLASIKYTDRKLKTLYEDADKDTVFIVIGDHGELLGDLKKLNTPIYGHQFGTFNDLIRVPCLIYSKSDLDLEFTSSLYDHRDLLDMIKTISEGEKNIEGREVTRSEYFSAASYMENFNRDYPNNMENLFSRKSFVIENSEFKLERASEGIKGFRKDGLNLEEKEMSSIPKKFTSQSMIFYSNYLEETE